MRRFKMVNRDQLLLLPPSLNDWVSANHPARFVVNFVETLDLAGFYSAYDSDKGGQPPYDPGMMLALVLYGQMLGISSSRQLERAVLEDIGFRFISGNASPDHDTIAEFRDRHRQRLREVFESAVQLAVKASIVRLGHVAVDGTKIRANASKAKRKTREQLQQERDRIKKLVGA